MENNSTNKYPLVTVFTLIYNTNPKFVIEAIESIRANNYPNLQHIIIDDCSTNPEPKKMVKEWIKNEKYACEFYEHETNYGVCKTLNHVLELAKGKYIFGCSDDIIYPNKIITEVQVLENLDDSYAATYSDATLIDEHSKSLYGLFIQQYKKFMRLPEGYIFQELVSGNFLPIMSMMFRTKCIREVGGYDESLSFEDYDLHLRIFKKHKIKLINTIHSKYRVHNDSLMFTNINWNIDYFKIYSKHLENNLAKEKIREIIRYVLSNSKSVSELKRYSIKFSFFWFYLRKILFLNSNRLFNYSIVLFQKKGFDLINLISQKDLNK